MTMALYAPIQTIDSLRFQPPHTLIFFKKQVNASRMRIQPLILYNQAEKTIILIALSSL